MSVHLYYKNYFRNRSYKRFEVKNWKAFTMKYFISITMRPKLVEGNFRILLRRVITFLYIFRIIFHIRLLVTS